MCSVNTRLATLFEPSTFNQLWELLGGIPQLLGAAASFTDIFKEGEIYNYIERLRVKYLRGKERVVIILIGR